MPPSRRALGCPLRWRLDDMDTYTTLLYMLPYVVVADFCLHAYVFARTRWLYRVLTGADEDGLQDIADVLGPALVTGAISAPRAIAKSLVKAVQEAKASDVADEVAAQLPIE